MSRAFTKKFYKVLPQFIKYQIVTKLFMVIVLVPTFAFIASLLLTSSGNDVLTNSTLFNFILSPQGIIFVILLFAVIVFNALLEIGGYIIISARALNNQAESSFMAILKYNLKQLPKMIGVGGLFIVAYFALILPLTDSDLAISFMRNFKIPNFISSVIFTTPLYFLTYTIIMIILSILSMVFIFTFHFMLIADLSVKAAMYQSYMMIKENWWSFIKSMFIFAIILTFGIFIIASIWFLLVGAIMLFANLQLTITRVVLMAMLIIQEFIVILFLAIFVPLNVFKLTELYYSLAIHSAKNTDYQSVYPILDAKQKPSFIDNLVNKKKTLMILFFAVVILLAIPFGYLLNEILIAPVDIKIIAHRAGGFTAPENSILGLSHSIKNEVDYVEIDVQRTKDGDYILNHDKTFKRLTGDYRTPAEMTLEEIKALDISEVKDGNIGVPTLKEFLIQAKDKIKVLIELKETSADRQMVDDTIALVRTLNMQDQVILISLKYDLIAYAENTYPNINTGYIYFLSMGDIAALEGDYLIMEEQEASDDRLDEVWLAGKKPIVWTVNTQESMDKFIHKNVYAIITDDMAGLKRTIENYNTLPFEEKILNLFLGEF